MFYRIFRLIASITLRLFYRRIDVDGPCELPDGPVLLVMNHTNALVDPLIPVIVIKRRLTLTGKNVLGRNPLLALLNWGLGTIPFHRKEDIGKGADLRKNVESMHRCREVLAAGGAVCVFPEGISHSDLKMRTFHPGAARIAMDYVRKDGNPGNLKIVPVGLLYTSKGAFRSEVYMRVGPALDAGEWASGHPGPVHETLTEELRRRIEELTISYQSRREMVILNLANEVIATEAKMPRPLGSLESRPSESFERLSRLQSGYRTLAADHGPEIEGLSDRVRQYRAELKRLGIEPGEVFLPMNVFRALLFLTRELELLLIGAPLAMFGAVNHAAPYWVVRTLARKLSSDRDHWATNVVYSSFVVFPVFYALHLAAAWVFLPITWALLYTVALPYTGFYALLYSERIGGAWRRARTFLYFLFRPKTQSRLRAEGEGIVEGVRKLARYMENPVAQKAGGA